MQIIVITVDKIIEIHEQSFAAIYVDRNRLFLPQFYILAISD